MTERRKILKVLSVAGVAGSAWTKPIVNSVLLPVHAQTTAATRITGTYSVKFYTDSTFSQEIPNGSEIEYCTPYVFVLTLSPRPGAPTKISIETVTDDVPNEPYIATTNEDGVVAIAVPGAGNCIAQNDDSLINGAGKMIAGMLISEAKAQFGGTAGLEFISAVRSADPSVLSPEEYSGESSLYFLILIGEI